MIIRPVTLSDIDKFAAPLSELGAVTFAESFGHIYSAEDLAFFVKKNHSETAYCKVIADPEQFLWIAQVDDQLAGYLLLAPNGLPCDPPLSNTLELKRLYVRACHQNLRIGQHLMDAAIAHGRDAAIEHIVLSVWSGNFAGHRFYRRNGFEKIGEYQFPVGEQLDDEWIMGKAL